MPKWKFQKNQWRSTGGLLGRYTNGFSVIFFLLKILNFVESVECKWYSFNLNDGKNGVWMNKAVFPDCVGLEISKDHEKMNLIIDSTSLDTFF